MIKVRYLSPGKPHNNRPFWVKEKNPYFNWYKNNRFYKVLEEREI